MCHTADVLAPAACDPTLVWSLRTQLWRAPCFLCGDVGSNPTVRSNVVAGVLLRGLGFIIQVRPGSKRRGPGLSPA